ncbi:TPR-like protein [Rhizodiscina lignyota]|uniref:TPR-like protein n=1 Tax=Rhizodiscina lignyota TaxID=1504668 RepID=A0A9P4M9A2_9PEZI|nr:TPR-like protein [Rhizodiscina lignyota]
MNIFQKTRKKSSQSTSPTKPDPAAPQRPSRPSSPPPTSPDKSSPTKDRDRGRRSPTKRTSKKPHHETDHPLNLPPEQRKRLSKMSAMSDSQPQPMDLDREQTASPSATPASPPPPPGSFPQTNGVNGTHAKEERPPTPPLHRTPTGPNLEDAESHKAAGNKFFKAKQYDKAIEEYTKAIDINPQSSTYRSNRAAAYMSANRYSEALEDAKVADELEPNSAKILLRLARIYTSLGRPQEALDVYSRIDPPVSAKDMQPATTMMQHIKLAEDQLRDGTSGSMVIHALDQAERGLGSGVDRPRKWRLMRGEAYLKMGNVNALGDAQTVAMGLLRNNNQDPEALVLRGRALYAQGENDKALQHFRQALSCDPDFKDAVKYLRMVQKLSRMKEEGNDHFKRGRYEEAIDVYTEALEVDPTNKGTNSKILLNRALCYLKKNDSKSALADSTRAIELDPSYVKARKTRAKALGESGDWEEAIREYKAVQEQHPEEPGLAKDIRHAELELKKSKRKDYYKILGVDKNADDNEIKKAYRKLAIVHHPDKNPGDEAAAERFKDVGEAYETLSDPQKRARYDSGEDLLDPADMFGGGMGGFGGGMGGVQIDPSMLFNMMHGGGGGGFSSFSGGGSPFGGMDGMGGGNPFGGMPGGMPGGRSRGRGYPF